MHDVSETREQFRTALRHTHKTRLDVADVEVAVGRFCEAMRGAGQSPERTLIDAKAVIEETIDGHDLTLAELAVKRCIEHYFRA